MKKIGIFTINGNNNYGNKLQNYALQNYLETIGFKSETIYCHSKKNLLLEFKKIAKHIFKENTRKKNFKNFDKLIFYSSSKVYNNKINIKYEYNYYIVGSDQVWNPLFSSFNDYFLLKDISDEKRISYAASFGISELPIKYNDRFKKELSKFKSISVREDAGKKIIENVVGRKDAEVLIDPTMLLTSKEWDKVSKKPKMLKNDKFILNYFLGNLSNERMKEIERVAKENDCEIINILDKKSPFYVCGPSEFLYLEKHAFLICTDSFHSSVFAILYNRPFIVFDREQNGLANMNSRLDTLISKFKLKGRKFTGKKITKENLNHDYTEAYQILEQEREKSKKFLTKALDIKDDDLNGK